MEYFTIIFGRLARLMNESRKGATKSATPATLSYYSFFHSQTFLSVFQTIGAIRVSSFQLNFSPGQQNCILHFARSTC